MAKSIQYYMRVLHRDIGFFVIALTVIYCLSGIVLTYEKTGFLKREALIEQQLRPGMPPAMIARIVRDRGFRIIGFQNDTISFEGRVSKGTYNGKTGELRYVGLKYPKIIEMFNKLHKTESDSKVHIFTVIYSVLLLFLAISSFFMYKANSKMLKRGVIISILGVVVSVILMLF